VGKRIRLSYINGILDTTIARRISSTEIIVAAAALSTQTNVTVHVGSGYGTAIYLGNSPNAKHHVFTRNHFVDCEYGIYQESGSFVLRDSNGTFNDTDIYVNGNTEPVEIVQWTSEASLRMLHVNSTLAPVAIRGARLSNFQQLANGFWHLTGTIYSEANTIEALPAANQVVWGDKRDGNLRMVSVADTNSVNMTTTQLGLPHMYQMPTMIRPSRFRDPDYLASQFPPALIVREGPLLLDGTHPGSRETWYEPVPFFHTRGTWNFGAREVTAWLMNLTDRASGATSKFLDFQIGGASKFSILKSGQVNSQSLTASRAVLTDENKNLVSGPAGLNGTISVRQGDDGRACAIVVSNGIVTSTTC
jgi:hypothetical protein